MPMWILFHFLNRIMKANIFILSSQKRSIDKIHHLTNLILKNSNEENIFSHVTAGLNLIPLAPTVPATKYFINFNEKTIFSFQFK